ncbi:hypothetical protein G6514_009632 [Epicoccum nigrum]|nr:hypothetical protein G6514_009632 [Epicoccum nigrum]
MMSEPTPELGGLSVGVLVGKVVGGGSVINVTQAGVRKASFPNYDFPNTQVVWEAFRSEGYPTPEEHAASDAVGAFWIPYALNPDTQTRSDARRTYYDSVKSHPNLKLVPNVSATKVLFDSLIASGVQFTDLVDNTSSKLYAKREVILAAGSVFTPRILQISGVGPSDVLKAAGVKVKKDLPAVGANLQDHPNANTIWDLSNLSTPNSLFSTDSAQNASAWAQCNTNRTGPVTQAHGNSVAFLSLQSITSSYKQIVSTIKSQNLTDYLPPAYQTNSALLRGYEAAKAITVELLSGTKAAAVEIPMTASSLQNVVVQRPLSRGTLCLNPANPAGNPLVRFGGFQNPADRTMLLEANNPILARYSPVKNVPGDVAQIDNEIIYALLANEGALMPTFAHQVGTCSMLPEKYGGCVGSDLRVYGTKKRSVVDALIILLIPATQLEATMYATAEKAADLIKLRNA